MLRSIGIVTPIEERIADRGFLIIDKMTVDVLLDTKFIDANVEPTSSRRRLVYPIETTAVAIPATKVGEDSVGEMGDGEE